MPHFPGSLSRFWSSPAAKKIVGDSRVAILASEVLRLSDENKRLAGELAALRNEIVLLKTDGVAFLKGQVEGLKEAVGQQADTLDLFQEKWRDASVEIAGRLKGVESAVASCKEESTLARREVSATDDLLIRLLVDVRDACDQFLEGDEEDDDE